MVWRELFLLASASTALVNAAVNRGKKDNVNESGPERLVAMHGWGKECYPTPACAHIGGFCVEDKCECKGTLDKYACRSGKGKHNKCMCCIPDDIICQNDGTTVAPTTTSDCPEGYFQVSGSRQCYKYYDDELRSWDESKAKCQAEGAVMAKPDNPIELRNYISNTYDSNTNSWLGARGTGTTVIWERDGSTLEASDPLWLIGFPGAQTTTFDCLKFASYGDAPIHSPNTVYRMHSCSAGHYNTVCEYLP